LVLALGNTGQQLSACSSIAAQLIGHEKTGYVVQAPQQLTKETLGCSLVPVLLDKDIQHLSILVHSPPSIEMLPTNRDKHLLELPSIAKPTPSMPKRVRKRLAELQTLLAHGLLANRDFAFSQQLLDIPETEAKAMRESHGRGNDLGWKRVPRYGEGYVFIEVKFAAPLAYWTLPYAQSSTALARIRG